MTQLVITLKDQSYLPNIRRIVKSLVGVEKVRKRLVRQNLLPSQLYAAVAFRVTSSHCLMPRKDE